MKKRLFVILILSLWKFDKIYHFLKMDKVNLLFFARRSIYAKARKTYFQARIPHIKNDFGSLKVSVALKRL